eukprot:Phypoly_transcript_14606.p1 GENE.Phypoly_transcript_14606~~Phypoly_transcript_14606.p1  ORF type:complete len:166 (+),score=35.46 Phypoly_transcript_14606:440-937(+)
MAFKYSALLLFVLALFGSSLATPFGCFNIITPTPRTGAGSSWQANGFGYQVYDIIISNETPNNCTAINCQPEFYFIQCNIIQQWNWNTQCINCNPDGTQQGDEATIGGPVPLWNGIAPGQVYDKAGFIVKYDLANADTYYVANGQPQSCACDMSAEYPECRTLYA